MIAERKTSLSRKKLIAPPAGAEAICCYDKAEVVGKANSARLSEFGKGSLFTAIVPQPAAP